MQHKWIQLFLHSNQSAAETAMQADKPAHQPADGDKTFWSQSVCAL